MKLKMTNWLLAVVLTSSLAACGSLPKGMISSPQVYLRDVQVTGLDFKHQTFLLSFDVANPNPFALPVRNVGYGVKLDGQLFASGETTSNFTVPANGDASFAISVDVNLLSTAPQLLTIVRNGTQRDIRYDLEGRLGVDLPLAPTLKYADRGVIRVTSGSY